MRTIDADALKELFSEVIGHIAQKPEMNGNLEHMIRASAMVIQMIDDAPTVQPVQRWIPCSERLPEEDTEVLISYRYKEGEGDTDHVNIDITSYGTTCFGGREIHTLKEWRQPFDYFHANYEVIAWMPLPEPYQERGE